ncbi:hypothetical protein BGX31_000818 [Mortierella sp. GBA43]|nr:hypothetical protein BGX31_000818 [Mortierella sp. GBA43]
MADDTESVDPATATATTRDDKNQTFDDTLREWVIPFVHRLGDGKDDAGGLTTAYSLLEEQEDADDFGNFITDMLKQLGSEDTSPSTKEPSLACLYACTEILVSETRTMKAIDDHLFTCKIEANNLPTVLQELQSHVIRVKRSLEPSQPLPFSLVKTDLKILLPTKAKTQAYLCK